MNLDNIINNVTILETLINDVALTNVAKTTQRELLFHNTLNDVLSEYITIKDTINYGDFLNDIFEELYSSTEKTSILSVLGTIENSLEVSAIKHNKISYINARDIVEYKISDTVLKSAIVDDADEYNKNLKAIIKSAKYARDTEILEDNEKLTEHLNTKTVEELETFLAIAKIVKSRKAAELKAKK